MLSPTTRGIKICIFMEHEDDELSSLGDEEDADDLTEDDFRDEGLTDINSDDDSVG